MTFAEGSQLMRNFFCSLLDLIPGTSANDLFPADCDAVDSNFTSFATVVIVLIAGIALFFR